HTFEVASDLIKYDFDRTELFAGMYEVKRELLHLKGYMYQNFKMDDNGAAFVKIDKAILDQFNVTASDTSQLVGALGDVKGICSCVIFVDDDIQIPLSLSSEGPIITLLATLFVGRGYPGATGACFHSLEGAERVIAVLKHVCD